MRSARPLAGTRHSHGAAPEAPVARPQAKVLVLDLDNTLWGGTVGEDGYAGLKLGSDYPGAFFRDLQRVALDLARRGVLLAIASKNNEPDAMEVISKHPGMLIRPEHLATHRINWKPKPENLMDMAKELSLGLDSFVFVDDIKSVFKAALLETKTSAKTVRGPRRIRKGAEAIV